MKIKIDEDKCIGCGACESLCPKVFKIEDDCKSHVIGDQEEMSKCDVKEAAENCPVDAIRIEE